MSLADDQAALVRVNALIAKLETDGITSKSNTGTGGDHAVSFQPLADLYKRQQDLESKIARATTGNFALARFGNGGCRRRW